MITVAPVWVNNLIDTFSRLEAYHKAQYFDANLRTGQPLSGCKLQNDIVLNLRSAH